ncbi:protein transport protein S31 [Kalmusia sp. IMI 367209]|nr:protein transport protein S31 [Kalmusia sp. IMI 367209]
MVRLREIPRTATFAWSPGPTQPLLATGTKAGAVDADFSNDTTLELWELNLDSADQGLELQPVATVNVESRFNGIAWSQPSEQYPRGIIAGALDSGALVLWDAEKLQDGESDALIEQIDKHTGPISAIQFNPFRPNILASAGAKGELYIHDLDDQSKSFRLGKAGANPDEYTSLDWNKKVAHILATGSSGGFVTVWDVKGKKENLTLNNYGRKTVSSVAWDPDVPTRLVTAIPTDQNPLVLVWDLRNSNAPEKTLQAHDQGVLSLSWCAQDSDILLSAGKDNRTIAWNPHTGEYLGEFPVVTNWTFQTAFNPSNPNLLATASFDGKIGIQSLQNTGAGTEQTKSTSQALDGEDFFSKTHVEPQGASFSLKTPPKWLRRRAGVSFGFGGKLVRFGIIESKSKVSISTFEVDSNIGAASEEFAKSLEQGDLAAICEAKIAKAATDEEKADWQVIETLISDSARGKLTEYLGFSGKEEEEPIEEKKEIEATDGAEEGSSFFDQSSEAGNFLSDLAASKGAKTNNPFSIYSGSESDAETKITQALMQGSFEKAVDVCLKENRLTDAFIIADCGDEKCKAKVRAAYFKKQTDGPNYTRLLASIVGNNLWDVVYNADLKDWKEVMLTLCTYADSKEFPDLCEALGDRLEEAITEDTESYRKDATFCYLAGSKLEKVVVNWAQELQENEAANVENSTSETSFSIHARSLQDFIEKVTVFRQVTKFQDGEQQKDSDWKLGPLYAKYVEYADIASAHGKLAIAEKYLDLLPEKYPAADVARDRIKKATRKAAPQTTAQRQTQATSAQRGSRVVPTYQAQPPASVPVAAPLQQPSSQYAPRLAEMLTLLRATNQMHSRLFPQPGGFGGYQPPQSHPIAPPPRNFSSSPSVPPAATRSNIPNWNDTPDFGPPKPASRRATPLNAVNSPFPNQPGLAGPPQGFSGGPSPTFPPTSRPTPPPPPKGPPQGPPRISSPPTSTAPASSPYAPTQQSNAYTPPPSSFAPPQQAPVPRGTSPYNPPPSSAPPSNRYAPAPGSTPSGPPAGMPPPRQRPPPTLQHRPHKHRLKQRRRLHEVPRRVHHELDPRQVARFRRGLLDQIHDLELLPRRKWRLLHLSTPPVIAHISPEASRPIFEILSADMQRVKAKAPAQYKTHVADTEKRLNILFDHLNNEDLLKSDTIQSMNELAGHIQARQYDQAIALFTDLMTNKTEEGSNWMIGVKRLIQFSKGTPH